MWQRPKPHGCNFFKSFSFARCKERVLYLYFLARYLGSIVAKDLVVSLWIARPEFSDRPKKKKKKLFFQQVSGMYCHPLCKFSISIEALKLKNFFRLRSFFSFLLLDITFTVQRLIQYWGAFLTFDVFTENFFGAFGGWEVSGPFVRLCYSIEVAFFSLRFSLLRFHEKNVGRRLGRWSDESCL